MDVGDLLVPVKRDINVSIHWKNSYYYFIEEIIYTNDDYNDNDNPKGISHYLFKNEIGNLFQEGFYFVERMIEKGLIKVVADDSIKAKLLLSCGLHNT